MKHISIPLSSGNSDDSKPIDRHVGFLQFSRHPSNPESSISKATFYVTANDPQALILRPSQCQSRAAPRSFPPNTDHLMILKATSPSNKQLFINRRTQIQQSATPRYIPNLPTTLGQDQDNCPRAGNNFEATRPLSYKSCGTTVELHNENHYLCSRFSEFSSSIGSNFPDNDAHFPLSSAVNAPIRPAHQSKSAGEKALRNCDIQLIEAGMSNDCESLYRTISTKKLERIRQWLIDVAIATGSRKEYFAQFEFVSRQALCTHAPILRDPFHAQQPI